jgi:hypothetical protein
MSDSKSELERRIARQSLRIEQVRLHLQALSNETFEFGRAMRWLEQLVVELALLRQGRKLAFFVPDSSRTEH